MHAGWSKSDLIDYKKAQRERLRLYSRVDGVLYDMCREWPDHKNIGIVQAKVRIIGRVYAAGLERKGERDKLKGIYETIAEIFHEDRTWIDSQIKELNKFKQLSKSSHEIILFAHGNRSFSVRSTLFTGGIHKKVGRSNWSCSLGYYVIELLG